MGTDKRARQKANREAKKAQEQAEAKAEAREESTRRIGLWVAIAVGIVGLILLFTWLRGGDDSAEGRTFVNPDEASQAEEASQAVELASSVPADFEAWAGTRALAQVQPAARANAYGDAPPMTIDPALEYRAVINTEAGPIRVELFPDIAPLAVNNFVNLANDGYYDGTTFHRVIEGFMAQGGDPTGTGAGSPGYSFADEFSSTQSFDGPGILAMANSGPATNGGQFFITFAPTPWLNEAHTIFGRIATVPGEDGETRVADTSVLDQITLTETGDGPTGLTPMRVDSIFVSESDPS